MIFVDTSFFIALLDPQDTNHPCAVDCLSFAVMEKLGIYEALAFDSDFGHRFVMRPGPKTG